MDAPRARSILTINGGSSSLKFALFGASDPPARIASGRVERVGGDGPRLVVAGEGDRPVEAPDQAAAVQRLIEWLDGSGRLGDVTLIGLRVVHGGGRYHRPEPVTDAMLSDLRRLVPCDPDHMPGAIDLIEALRRRFPALPLVACFDTAFHHDLPREAQILPIPRRYEAAGVRRYGFHGLSYAFLMEELGRVAPGRPRAG